MKVKMDLLVVEENGEIVGLAHGREYAGVCHLHFMGLRREYRSMGIDEALLAALLKRQGREAPIKFGFTPLLTFCQQ
ncbi:MAG: GNAT family N-acetyltransferase [Candidatus Bathycorpusculaceae bacterium]